MRPPVPLPDYQRRYAATKIVRLFKTLKRLEFSGQVIWRENAAAELASSDEQQWRVFLEKGNLRYGTGGCHSLRRWQRHLFACCPNLPDRAIASLGPATASMQGGTLTDCWEYQQLDRLLQQRYITPQQHRHIVEQILTELLFDVAQGMNVSYLLQRYPTRSDALSPAGGALAEETIFAAIEAQWQQWFEAKLYRYSPNLAPIVRQPEPLRAETSPPVFQALMTLLDGRQPLRDLAIRTQRGVQPFMQVLLPYVQSGWIDLLVIPDLSISAAPIRPQPPTEPAPPPLIACIDDSPMICQSMEQVIRAAGYRFVAITEASRAIATLLTKKPDIIFLDLIMPDTNGYEICSQLRKVTRFKETPIIILTGNDGIVDQVRARLLGATDFLSKPMEPAVILNTIRRLIEQRT